MYLIYYFYRCLPHIRISSSGLGHMCRHKIVQFIMLGKSVYTTILVCPTPAISIARYNEILSPLFSGSFICNEKTSVRTRKVSIIALPM